MLASEDFCLMCLPLARPRQHTKTVGIGRIHIGLRSRSGYSTSNKADFVWADGKNPGADYGFESCEYWVY